MTSGGLIGTNIITRMEVTSGDLIGTNISQGWRRPLVVSLELIYHKDGGDIWWSHWN